MISRRNVLVGIPILKIVDQGSASCRLMSISGPLSALLDYLKVEPRLSLDEALLKLLGASATLPTPTIENNGTFAHYSLRKPDGRYDPNFQILYGVWATPQPSLNPRNPWREKCSLTLGHWYGFECSSFRRVVDTLWGLPDQRGLSGYSVNPTAVLAASPTKRVVVTTVLGSTPDSIGMMDFTLELLGDPHQ